MQRQYSTAARHHWGGVVVRAECWRTLEGVVDHGDVRLRHWAVRVVRTEITWHLAASH
jgi:uncharacterized membrane protein